MARPSKYETNVKPHLELIEGWARDGDTDATIAKKLDISNDRLIEYKKNHPEFLEILKKGKEVIDYKVENALLKRAFGYDYVETTTEKIGGKIIKIKEVIKHVPADTTAQIFWMKNRRRDKWRDRWEAPPDGDGGLADSIEAIEDQDG